MATKGTATKAAGCFKCGAKDHWSRDCTKPPSEWINKQPFPGSAAKTAGVAGGDKTAAAAEGPNSGENDPANDQDLLGPKPALDAASKRRKRPKVTVELLKGPGGLPDVHAHFAAAFRRQFKGRGHEAGDLRRLLEMYKRWQERLFPSDFDTFIMGLEKLSATYVMKDELRKMRMDLLQMAQDARHSPAEEGEGGGAQDMEDAFNAVAAEAEAEGAQRAAQQGAGGEPAPPEEEEDELYELVEPEEFDPMEDEFMDDYFQAQQGQQQGAMAPEDELYELVVGSDPNPDELMLAEELGEGGGAAQQGAPAAEGELYVLEEGSLEEEGGAALDGEEAAAGAAGPAEAQSQPPPQQQQEFPDGPGAAAAGSALVEAGRRGGEDVPAEENEEDADALDAELLALAVQAQPTQTAGASMGPPPPVQQRQQQQQQLGAQASQAVSGPVVVGTEASGVGLEQIGTQDVVNAAYLQIAALHDSEPGSQLGEEEEELLRMTRQAD